MTAKQLDQIRWLRKEIKRDEMRLSKMQKDGREKSALFAAVKRKKDKCERKKAEAQDAIADVSDSISRMALEMRYIDGYSWVRIAAVIGGGNTPDGIRKRAMREVAKK